MNNLILEQSEDTAITGFPVLYRYVDHLHHDGVYLHLEKYYTVRETNCFYIYIDEWSYSAFKRSGIIQGRVRRASKDGLRRRCYPTKNEAIKSYLKRKESQLMHAKEALQKAEIAMNHINNELYDHNSEDAMMGRPDCLDTYIF